MKAVALLVAGAVGGPGSDAATTPSSAMALSPLAGTWTLVAAERWLPDGRTVDDYGVHPHGRLIVDADGRYSLQIFRSDRSRFAAGDKAAGTDAEFREAVLGESTHYGRLAVDADSSTLTFDIEGASFPNWEGTTQHRAYTLDGDTLRYRVPPRSDGAVPISIWRRILP